MQVPFFMTENGDISKGGRSGCLSAGGVEKGHPRRVAEMSGFTEVKIFCVAFFPCAPIILLLVQTIADLVG